MANSEVLFFSEVSGCVYPRFGTLLTLYGRGEVVRKSINNVGGGDVAPLLNVWEGILLNSEIRGDKEQKSKRAM